MLLATIEFDKLPPPLDKLLWAALAANGLVTSSLPKLSEKKKNIKQSQKVYQNETEHIKRLVSDKKCCNNRFSDV